MAALDEYRHLTIEKRQQQRSYVAPIDVRICHNYDAVISQLVDVEIVAPDAGSQRGDERADFGGREHLVEARLLHVEDFSLERQDGLSAPVAALLGGTAGGIALLNKLFREPLTFPFAIVKIPRRAQNAGDA